MNLMKYLGCYFFIISSVFSEVIELERPQIKEKYLRAVSNCYQFKKDQDAIGECRPVIKLAEKKQIIKTLN